MPFERFEHEIVVCRTFSPEMTSKGDIVILDVSTDESLHKIRESCKQDALLVLCTQHKAAASLDVSSYDVLDEVWDRPFPPGFISFRLKKMLTLIKLRKDCRLSQIYLDTTIDSIPDLVWFKDLRGAHLKVNDSFCHAVGKTKQDIEGRGHYYIWDLKKEEYERGEYVCLETEEMVLQARKTCLFDEKVKSKHGMRQFKTYKSPLFDDDGEIIGTVGIAHDVTDLENMDAELEIILRSMPFAILVKDEQGRIIKANEKFEEYFHAKKEDVIGKAYDTWKGVTLADMTAIGSEGYAEARPCFDGKTKVIEIHEEPIYDVFHNLVGQLCICRDVTRERTLEQQILHNANTDALTGLYNRRYFYEYMEKNREEKPIGLLYMDIDNFKMVNDSYGHQVGDEALVQVARLLWKSFPSALIARVGGDEFLIAILGECGIPTLEEMARSFLQKMEENFKKSDKLRILSASIGIAMATDPALKIDELIKLADMALYEAKHRGKARYFVYTSGLQNCGENMNAFRKR